MGGKIIRIKLFAISGIIFSVLNTSHILAMDTSYVDEAIPANISDKIDFDYDIMQSRANTSKYINIPSGGRIISNIWRQSGSSAVGNTLQWDYQVSAQYTGDKKVERIRTTWYTQATLRNGSSISMGIIWRYC